MGILTYKDDRFYMDGKPYVILSGAMHYFRIPREYWRDRLLKLRECGFNTVETYTCWNLHEPQEGEFDFSGNLDIVEYIKIAGELGLNVILRPGPYICAEWEFGGFPYWLLTYKDISLRCNDPLFLSKVKNYYGRLLPLVRPYLAVNGGNIIMLQVENEYGSYGDDKEYLRAVADIYKQHNMDCLYFTSDGPTYTMLSGGTLDEYLCVANFGSRPKERLNILKEFKKDQPLMCGEYWCGWFDHWFEEHHIRPMDEIISDVKDFLDIGASFNFYMFHGGTNFGFMNGANYTTKYAATVTSYDYNSPLNEAGDRTPTYYKIRELISAHFGEPAPMTAADSKKQAYGTITFTEIAPLFSNLSRLSSPVHYPTPKYMEDLGQAYGYILYRSVIKGPRNDWELDFDAVHDRALVYINGVYRGTYTRWDKSANKVKLPLGKDETATIDILVENMGRVNYGNKLLDRKGAIGIRFGLSYHFGWDIYTLPMTDLSTLSFESISDSSITCPAFFRAELQIDGEPCDTFIRLNGFKKGFVCVNGINIGRYFNDAGPQKTLYVPAPFLNRGNNEIIVFESDETTSPTATFTDEPDLGKTKKFDV